MVRVSPRAVPWPPSSLFLGDGPLLEGRMAMGFDEYQDAAFATAIYPGAGTGTYPALAYTALGLGEVGELQGKIKKIYRDQSGEFDPAMRQYLAAEVGDILWYLAVMAKELGVPLSGIAEGNIAKLRSRAERAVLGGSGDDR